MSIGLVFEIQGVKVENFELEISHNILKSLSRVDKCMDDPLIWPPQTIFSLGPAPILTLKGGFYDYYMNIIWFLGYGQ